MKSVPDSLIREFTTAAGRKVYDGGGIMPDIRTEPEYISRFAVTLYALGFVEDFVDGYMRRHAGEPFDLKGFALDSATYDDFVAFMKDKKVPYESETRRALKSLRKAAEGERYTELDKRLEELEAEVRDDTQTNLETYRQEISETLENEIIRRYASSQGGIEHSLPGDGEVQRAVEVLSSPDEYRRITREQDTARK